MRARNLSAILVTAAASLGASSATCTGAGGPPDAAALATYTATGVVRAVDADKRTILIAHQDIAGYMKAMTMQFDLRDAAQAREVAVGDKVQFSFTDDGQGHLVVQSLRKVP